MHADVGIFKLKKYRNPGGMALVLFASECE